MHPELPPAPQLDPLDAILSAAAPPATPASPELRAELVTMVAASGREAGRSATPRRLGRIGIGLAATALVFGGATATAAAGGVNIFTWSPWAKTPDYTLVYTLPSGAHCEKRVGNYEGADPAAADAVKEYSLRVDLLDAADIDGAIADSRAGTNVYFDERGAEVVGGFGTEYYNADTEYTTAVSIAVDDLIRDELARQGFPETALGTGVEGQASCPGANW